MAKRIMGRWKRGVVAALVVAALLGVLWFASGWWVGRRADAVMRGIDERYAALGVPADPAAWVTPGDAATRVFLAGGPSLRSWANPGVSVGRLAEEPGWTRHWPAAQVAVMRMELALHEGAWAEAEAAHDTGLGAVGDTPGGATQLADLRRWGRCYETIARMEAAVHGPGAAVPWVHRILDLAAVSFAGPGAVEQVVGASLVSMAYGLIERELSRYAFAAADLRGLADRIEAVAGQADGARAAAWQLTLFRAGMGTVAADVGDDAAWDASALPFLVWAEGNRFDQLGLSWDELPGVADEVDRSAMGLRVSWVWTHTARRVRPRVFEVALREPVGEALDVYEALRAGGAEALALEARGEHWPASGLEWVDTVRAVLRTIGQMRDGAAAAVGALRVEAARVEAGTWPTGDERAALLGVDRQGRALRMTRLQDGWLVYSVGVNGEDDAGRWRLDRSRSLPPTKEELMAGAGERLYELDARDDRAFRLWDEAARGKPAPGWPARRERDQERDRW